MHPNRYQKAAVSTEIYSFASNEFIREIIFTRPVLSNEGTFGSEYEPFTQCLQLMYCAGKLNGEAGEIAELIFKSFRGNRGQLTEEEKIKLVKELGDVMWYVANIADLIEVELDDIMETNIEKLKDRKERGVIHGYGDER